jgi:hypothetical protein
VLRAVELVVKQYLQAIPGFAKLPSNRNWGEYLKLLRDNNAAKEVTDTLQNIKDNYRNPVMHPEDTLLLKDATSLFALCQGMIETLIADMKKRGFITCPTAKPTNSTL